MKIDRTTIVAGVVGAVIIATGAFYAGEAHGKSALPARGQFGAGLSGGGQFGARGMGGQAGFVVGQILAQDGASITVQMQNGSSKIVLVATSTAVTKSAAGSLSDLTVGQNVSVMGTPNSDGSITAQSVQLRPAGSPMQGGMPRTPRGQ